MFISGLLSVHRVLRSGRQFRGYAQAQGGRNLRPLVGERAVEELLADEGDRSDADASASLRLLHDLRIGQVALLIRDTQAAQPAFQRVAVGASRRGVDDEGAVHATSDRKSTRLNSSH